MLAGRNRINQLSAGIEDLNLQITEDVTAFLVVRNESVRRAPWTGKAFISLGPTTICIDVLDSRPGRDKGRILRHQFRSQSAKRGDIIDDPDAATVSRQHQV